MKTTLPFRILWLTDIHFSSHYATLPGKEAIEHYFDTFIGNLSEQNNPFDYIIITGDISQNGKSDDFKAFWEMFLKKLLDYFLLENPNHLPLVITIPGNHDIDWDKGDFLDDFVGSLGENAKGWPKRTEYLKNYEDKFHDLFRDYTIFIRNCATCEEGKYASFFIQQPDNSLSENYNSTIVCPKYLDKRLYGYFVDIKKQVIIVLLNSAWYSLGKNFDERLAKKIVVEPEFQQKVNYILKKLKEKEYVTEYNTQVSGIHLMDNEHLNKIIEDYPEFTLITCIHHPMNWLAWPEYHSYDHDPQNNANLFKNLLDKSDILLTGHEHVPNKIDVDRIAKNTVHLKGGCFLNYFQPKETDATVKIEFKHNWFSILKYDPYGANLHQYRYFLLNDEKPFIFSREHNGPILLSKKGGKYELTTSRKAAIINSARKKNFDRTKLFLYLKIQGHMDEQANELIEIAIPGEFQDLMNCYYTKQHEFYFLIKEPFSYELLNESFYKFIERIIPIDGESAILRFLLPDIFVLTNKEENPPKHYSKPYPLREEILASITKTADMQFERFRHKFFYRYEKQPQPQLFPSISTMKFVNQVIPYWIYEKIWLE